MPVLGIDDECARRLGAPDLTVHEGNDRLAFANIEAAAGIGEVVLQVDHDQGSVRIVVAHQTPPAKMIAPVECKPAEGWRAPGAPTLAPVER